MGKGKAVRRRASNAIRSRHGNLALAQLGKGSTALPLPSAPTPKQLVDKPSASLRKMLALKEAAEKQQNKAQRRPAAANKPPQQPSGAAMDVAEQPSTSGRDQPHSLQQQGEQASAKQQQQQQQQSSSKAMADPFQQVNKLKPRKKEYLKNKALKKKGKHLARMQEAVEKERATDHVAFGERVDRPLAVNLKRKHWAGAERSAAERCKSVFLQQMAAAERKVHAGGAAAEAGGSAAHKAGQGQGGKAGQRQHQARQQVVKASKLQAGDHEEVRQQVIDAYRAKRNTRPVEGAADLGTLRQLTGVQ